MKKLTVLAMAATLAACGSDNDDKNETNTGLPAAAASQAPAAINHYADLAHAVYSDSLTTAETLKEKIDALVTAPSSQTFTAAKEAWIASRVPYQQSEVFRFGNEIVDDWEGQLNAWPLDEGLIDYVFISDDVSDARNYTADTAFAKADVVANADVSITLSDGVTDLSDSLDTDFLRNLHEIGGSEANVATGYHAIEFLLWGQDLNLKGAGAGERTHTDYLSDAATCTNANCDRRGEYLKAAAALLVTDLTEMVDQWKDGGDYRNTLNTEVAATPKATINRIFTSLAKLSAGELAGERINTALRDNSTEDEHDCFSDNTHNSHFNNAVGLNNLYLGRYETVAGQTITGTSLYEIIKAVNVDVAELSKTKMAEALAQVQDIQVEGEKADGQKFDQLIDGSNTQGNAMVQEAIDALIEAGDQFVNAAKVLNVDVTTDV